ncbi:MAG: hypothetical protein ACKPJO_14385 [Dolichospermum sp.]
MKETYIDDSLIYTVYWVGIGYLCDCKRPGRKNILKPSVAFSNSSTRESKLLTKEAAMNWIKILDRNFNRTGQETFVMLNSFTGKRFPLNKDE